MKSLAPFVEPGWLKPLSLPRSIVTFHLVIRTLNKERDPKLTNQRAVNQQKNEHRTSEKDPRAKNQRALN
jgi:hypothetical protein